MYSTLLLCYVAAGMITAVATMYIFPPMEGFRPSIGIRAIAAFSFTAFWPFLLFVATWYVIIGQMNQPTLDSRPLHASLHTGPIPGAVTKPR